MAKKFKVKETNAKDLPTWANEKDGIEWEGEHVTAESDTKLEHDLGTGQPVILRFFDFGANAETFKTHKPTAQELFNTHIKGMESLLWTDGLQPFPEVEPRLMFSKDKTQYRFVLACIPAKGNMLFNDAKTLSQILKNDTTENSDSISRVV